MKKTYLLYSLFLLIPTFVIAQPLDLSFEFQAYPTGLIPGIQIEKGFGAKDAVHLRLGYQHIRHGDWGVQEDERGNGYGFSLGYKHYLKEGFAGWFWGLRNDFWWNTLDWKNNIGELNEIGGTSEIIVIQPTAMAGYLFELGKTGFFTPTIAFGFEVNVETEGEEMGQGAILLLGFEIGKRF